MIQINLSDQAMRGVKKAAQSMDKTIEKAIEELLEELFIDDHGCYMVLRPAPDADRINAIAEFAQYLINMKDFYGFKFLTPEEAMQYAVEHGAQALGVEPPNYVMRPLSADYEYVDAPPSKMLQHPWEFWKNNKDTVTWRKPHICDAFNNEVCTYCGRGRGEQ
jgi:hypothetical protein